MDYKSLGYLFKNKLSQRKFEMKDAYWEDAEQLIIESNKRRQKKRVLFSLVAILLIVTALMGVFDYNSENGEIENSLTFNNESPSENNESRLENVRSKKESVAGTEKTLTITEQSTLEEAREGLDKAPFQRNLSLNEETATEKSESVKMGAISEEKGDGSDKTLDQNDLLPNDRGNTDESPAIADEPISIEMEETFNNALFQNNLSMSEKVDTEKSTDVTYKVTAEEKGDDLDNLLIPKDQHGYTAGDTQNPTGFIDEMVSEEENLGNVLLQNDVSDSMKEGTKKSLVVGNYSIPDTSSISANTEITESPVMSKPDTSGKGSNKSRFSISLYGSIFSMNKYLTTNNQSYNNHVDRRKKEEQSILSYGGGAKLNYHIGNWLISAGIGYNNLGEKTNYSATVSQQTETIVSDNSFWSIASFSYWSTDSVGNPELVELVDSNYVEVINSKDTTHTLTDNSVAEQNGNTKLTYIEVPILIGYELPLNKLAISIKTGISFGFLMSSKGDYLNRSNDQLLNISTTPDYLNTTVISYVLEIGTNYKLSESITLLVEPTYKLNLTSVLQKQYEISQKYYSIGLNMGINYRF